MASPMISSPVVRASKRAAKNKKQHQLTTQAEARNAQWKSSAQQEAYSSSLFRALRHVSIDSAPPPTTRAVREAADRALAAAAKGRTRWSRAILQTRLRLKLKLFSKGKRKVSRAKKPRVSVVRLKSKAVQRKVRVLGRLVPGCRKEAVPVILEEAADYVAALQMQVRAMTALAHLLSVGSAHDNVVINR